MIRLRSASIPWRVQLVGLAGLLLLATAGACHRACDRRTEPPTPGEQPAQPDLSKIFPPGAERPADLPPGMPLPPQRGAAPLAAESGGEPIRGTLRLAEKLRGRVPPDAVLFLIARNAESGPPLAVKRIPQPSFPLDFEIGPDDRMIKAMPFTGPVQISARLDGDGNATSRQPGDLQGTAPQPAQPGDSGVELEIDTAL